MDFLQWFCFLEYKLYNRCPFAEQIHEDLSSLIRINYTFNLSLTLTLPSPYVGMGGSLTATVA